MPRPPRALSQAILNSLDKRPKLRYTLTKKGAKLLEKGETVYSSELDSLVEAIDANNGQPVSLLSWNQFSGKPVRNVALKELVTSQTISIVSRGRFSFATR